MVAGATLRRDAVRRLYDTYRWVGQRVDPSFQVPKGGYPRRDAIDQVTTSSRRLAITFDDGPDPDQTPRLLDLLDERGIVATFYLIGSKVQGHPEIARRIASAGHELGNHSWSHGFLTTQSARSVRREIEETNLVIEEVTGVRPETLRPPYGAVTPSLSGWVEQDFGLRTVLWSVDAADWEDPEPETITERLTESIDPGAILLAHDPLPNTVAAMPETLDRLVEDGFELVPISALLGSG